MQIVYTSTNYKSVVYRAVLSIILGVVLVSWPGAALKYIIMLIGLIFLLTGLISYVMTNREREVRSRYFAPFSGIGSLIRLVIALPAFFFPFDFYVRVRFHPGCSGYRPVCDVGSSPAVRTCFFCQLSVPCAYFCSRNRYFI